MFDGKLQVDLLLLGDLIASRAMAVFSTHSRLVPGRPRKLREVRDASCGARVGVLEQPKCFQVDGGGEWKSEGSPDLRLDRRIKLQFKVGCAPLDSCASGELARSICYWLVADDRFSGRQTLCGA